ncbi:hypothetical protein DRJ48_03695 [Candidatus Woesearchaeota archaeon]|nr:hypothetical protein [Candidatus Woesearchaeota archaeon]RLE42358.1 MAG: hypothetical protein DRJ48_03695 [Candidatus Woesearchaeota archaeon]
MEQSMGLLGYSRMEQIVLIGVGLAALEEWSTIESKVIPEFSKVFEEEYKGFPTPGIFSLFTKGLGSNNESVRRYTTTILPLFFSQCQYWGTKHSEVFKKAEEVAYNPQENPWVRYYATVALLTAIHTHPTQLEMYIQLVRSHYWQLQRNLRDGKRSLGMPEEEVEHYLEKLRFL